MGCGFGENHDLVKAPREEGVDHVRTIPITSTLPSIIDLEVPYPKIYLLPYIRYAVLTRDHPKTPLATLPICIVHIVVPFHNTETDNKTSSIETLTTQRKGPKHNSYLSIHPSIHPSIRNPSTYLPSTSHHTRPPLGTIHPPQHQRSSRNPFGHTHTHTQSETSRH